MHLSLGMMVFLAEFFSGQQNYLHILLPLLTHLLYSKLTSTWQLQGMQFPEQQGEGQAAQKTRNVRRATQLYWATHIYLHAENGKP